MISILCEYFLGGLSTSSILMDVLVVLLTALNTTRPVGSMKKTSDDKWTFFKF